jgi:hypothetical protein
VISTATDGVIKTLSGIDPDDIGIAVAPSGTAPSPPTVILVNPSSGPTTGGIAVTVTGTNFTGATKLTFAGAEAPSFTVVNSTTITAITPSGSAGPASVVVTTPAGSNAPNTLYTYTVPTVPTAPALGEWGLIGLAGLLVLLGAYTFSGFWPRTACWRARLRMASQCLQVFAEPRPRGSGRSETCFPESCKHPLPLESNGCRVLQRIGYGRAQKDYGATYRSIQEALAGQIPRDAASLTRAHLLLRYHGKVVCRNNRPLCIECSLAAECAFPGKQV